MTRLEAWKKWCEQVAGMDATEYTLEKSSHGKAFSYAWDAAVKAEREACAKVCEEQADSPALTSLEQYRAKFIADAIRAKGKL